MRMMTSSNSAANKTPLQPPLRGPEFNISAKDVEGLVMEIKENLRLSTSMKALPCTHLSRKSSRASPYRVPGKGQQPCSCDNGSQSLKARYRNKQSQIDIDDPYEYLQKLLSEGSLVNEAVRRLQLGLSPKQRYFYESDEESTPALPLCSQANWSQVSVVSF